MNKYTQPTMEQRQILLDILGESERWVREAERKNITSLSRTQTWLLERSKKHPPRIQLGNKSVAWLLSDLLWFIYQPAFSSNSHPLTKSAHTRGGKK